MGSLLKVVLEFLPNVVKSYKAKPLAQASEIWVALGTLVAYFVVRQGWLDESTFNTVVWPAVVVILQRFLSKGLNAPAAA